MIDYNVEQLREMIKGLSFKDFEKRASGNIYKCGIRFHMRIGLHMRRPSQVIMACGKYVRIHPYQTALNNLIRLNPEEPDSALYDNTSSFRWKPTRYPNLGEIISTTLKNRSAELAANMGRNNAAFARLTRRK